MFLFYALYVSRYQAHVCVCVCVYYVVIELKNAERRKDERTRELEALAEERDTAIEHLRSTLRHAEADFERRLQNQTKVRISLCSCLCLSLSFSMYVCSGI